MKKTLLTVTFIIISLALLISGILLTAYADIPFGARIFIGVITGILFLFFTFLACETERKSGVYICTKCGKKFEINAQRYLFSSHLLRSRRLSCPSCGRKSYCKYKTKESLK